MTTDNPVREMLSSLAAPFAETEVKFKPQAVKGNRALALAYVDVRAIMDRLDSVAGPENWKDAYRVLPDNSVVCELSIRLGDEWLTKEDVGGPSEQPDGGDRMKSAFSDAMKRTAVKWGIGRYLYRLPQQWADYDPSKRQFTAPPRLPDWARAKPAAGPNRAAKPDAAPAAGGRPKNGAELHSRLRQADAALAADGRAVIGALLSHVTQAGVKAGFGADLNRWQGPAIDLAIKAARDFKTGLDGKPHREEDKEPPAGRPAGMSEQEYARSHNFAGARRITNADADALFHAIKAGGLDVGDFLEYFDVPKIDDLPAVNLDHAREIINRRSRRPASQRG